MVRQRARIRFRKQQDLRLIGHRDLARLLERLFRRAGIRVAMSEGFHPKPRMSFPSALALGIEGFDEVMELELVEPCTADELRGQLARQAVPGLSFSSVEILPPGTKKARLRSASYELSVPADRHAALIARLGPLSDTPDASALAVPGPDADLVRRSLEEIQWLDGVVRFRLRASQERSAGPRDVLAAIGLDDLERSGATLIRSEVRLEP
jgi:radical SAM-linked protein